MEIEHISNDHNHFAYVEGHVHLGDFLEEVWEYGHLDAKEPRHGWLVERPVPDDLRAEFSTWFTFCDKDEPRAFPVTWCIVV